MPVKSLKDILIFIVLVILAILVAKFIGSKIPVIGKITDQI